MLGNNAQFLFMYFCTKGVHDQKHLEVTSQWPVLVGMFLVFSYKNRVSPSDRNYFRGM